jgi:hypothetical protein
MTSDEFKKRTKYIRRDIGELRIEQDEKIFRAYSKGREVAVLEICSPLTHKITIHAPFSESRRIEEEKEKRLKEYKNRVKNDNDIVEYAKHLLRKKECETCSHQKNEICYINPYSQTICIDYIEIDESLL